MRKIFLIIMLLALPLCLYAVEVGKIVAQVNNEVITAKDLEDYYKMLSYRMPDLVQNLPRDKKLAKKEALDRMIEDKLILEEAKKTKLEILSYLIDNQLKKIISSYPTREEFENSLLERGINVSLLKERIKGQFMMRQLITEQVSSYISVSPQEIATFYKEHESEMQSLPKYTLGIAKTKDKNILSAITKTVKSNSFEQAKQDYNNLFTSLEATENELDEDLSNALKALKEKEFVVKKINEEYFFIYLEKITPPQKLSLEEANERIYSIIWDKKFKKRFTEWVKKLRDDAIVVIYSDEL